MLNYKNNIYLRALKTTDYKISVKWRNDPDIWKLTLGKRYLVSEEYEKKWIENTIFNSKDIRLAICIKSNDKYIGNVYLTNIDYYNREAKEQLFIGEKSEWGKGFAFEALMQILEFGFYERNLHRIYTEIMEEHIASRKLANKCSFREEGLLRDKIIKNGEYKNVVIFSILRKEFENLIK